MTLRPPPQRSVINTHSLGYYLKQKMRSSGHNKHRQAVYRWPERLALRNLPSWRQFQP